MNTHLLQKNESSGMLPHVREGPRSVRVPEDIGFLMRNRSSAHLRFQVHRYFFSPGIPEISENNLNSHDLARLKQERRLLFNMMSIEYSERRPVIPRNQGVPIESNQEELPPSPPPLMRSSAENNFVRGLWDNRTSDTLKLDVYEYFFSPQLSVVTRNNLDNVELEELLSERMLLHHMMSVEDSIRQRKEETIEHALKTHLPEAVVCLVLAYGYPLSFHF